MSQTKAQLIDTLVASLLPASDSAVDIGSNAVRFANIYGDTLYGNGANLTGINTDLVSDTSPQLGGDLQSNGNDIDFADNDKAIFGTGTDLQIYHGGTNSIIQNSTGDLYFKNTNNLFIQVNDTEAAIYARPNAAVELYYDNSKKLETKSTGVIVSNQGNNRILDVHHTNGDNAYIAFLDQNTTDNSIVRLGAIANEMTIFSGGSEVLRLTSNRDVNIPTDGKKLQLGASQDLQIYHDGSNSRIHDDGTGILAISGNQIDLQSANQSESLLQAVENGAVKLRFDNSQKFETTSAGVSVTGTIESTNHIQITHTSPSLYLTDSDNNPDYVLRNNGGQFIIRDDTAGVTRLAVNTDGHVDITGNLDLPDNTSGNASLRFGNSQDFFMNHNGTDSFIINNTGDLYIRDLNGDVHIQGKDSEESIIAKADGAVELYYNNGKRFETLSTGAKVTGQLNFDDGSSTANTNGIGFGSSQDCRLFHSGSAFQIRNVTGPVTCITPSHFQISADSSNDTMFKAIQDQGVELYYDNNKRFETITDGARLTSATPQIAFHANGVNNAGQIKLSESSGGGVMRFFTKTTGGTETERARFQTGGGISFNGDTAADNALDDYEEGTWSPSGSWTTITASYTKIGRMVYAGFSLRANTNDGSNVTIGNLPFTSGSTHGHVGGIVWGLCEFNTTDSWLNGSVDDDSTTATVRRGSATIVTFGSGNNNMNQNAFIRGMIIYMTA